MGSASSGFEFIGVVPHMISRIFGLLRVASAALFVACAPALAQQGVLQHGIPVSHGPVSSGAFGTLGPCPLGAPIVGAGLSADPVCGSISPTGVSAFNGLTGSVVFKTPGLVNGKIVESHASNAATFALKTLAGADPSAGDPVFAVFPDGSTLTITAALSFTLSSGSTVGATNSVAFRLWFVLFNDAGTARIGAQKCITATGFKGFPGHGVHSSTAEGGAGAADSAGVTYTGTAVTSKPFIPIAFADYNSGLATAGTWAVSPSAPTIWTQGMPLPGTPLQSDSSSTSTQSTSTSSTYISTGASVSMTLSSPCNTFSVYAETDLAVDVPSIIGATAIRSGGVTLGKPKTTFVASGTPAFGVMQFSSAAMGAYYAPGDVSLHIFAVGVALVFGSGTATAPTTNGGAVISVTEIMG